MPRFGWEGQYGAGEPEATFGTAVAITRFFEHVSGEVQFGDGTLVSPGIRGARERILSAAAQGRKVVGYRLATDFQYKGMAFLWKHALGAVATVNPVAGVWDHTFTRANALPVGLTQELEQAPDFYKLAGCKINELILESDAEGYPRVTWAGPAKDYTIAGSGAAYAPPSGQIFGVFHQAALTIDAVAKQYRRFRCRIFNDLQIDDFRSGARTVFSADPRDYMVEGTIVLTAEENAQLVKLRDFVTAALVVKLTGPVIPATAHNFELEYTLPKVLYRPTGRRISSPTDESLFELEFEGFKDSADALTVRIKNTDSTP